MTERISSYSWSIGKFITFYLHPLWSLFLMHFGVACETADRSMSRVIAGPKLKAEQVRETRGTYDFPDTATKDQEHNGVIELVSNYVLELREGNRHKWKRSDYHYPVSELHSRAQILASWSWPNLNEDIQVSPRPTRHARRNKAQRNITSNRDKSPRKVKESKESITGRESKFRIRY